MFSSVEHGTLSQSWAKRMQAELEAACAAGRAVGAADQLAVLATGLARDLLVGQSGRVDAVQNYMAGVAALESSGVSLAERWVRHPQGYIYTNRDQTGGAFQPERPELGAGEEILELPNVKALPVREHLAVVASLLEQLAKVPGREQDIAAVIELAENAVQASHPSFNASRWGQFGRDMAETTLGGGDPRQTINEFAQRVARARGVFLADGVLVGSATVARDAALLADHATGEDVGPGANELLRLLMTPTPAVTGPFLPHHVVYSTVLPLAVRRGLGSALFELSASYRDDGDWLLEDALNATSYGSFFGLLYVAAAPFFTASMLFALIASAPSEMVDRHTSERARRGANVSEEKFVRICDALGGAVRNSDGKRFRRHRNEISRAANVGGRVASQRLADWLIESRYDYPRGMKGKLLET